MCLVDQLSWYILILNAELIGVSVPAQSDAWRGEWHREHPEEPGHREDDSGGLWHPAGHQPDLRQAGYVFIKSQLHQTVKLLLKAFTDSKTLPACQTAIWEHKHGTWLSHWIMTLASVILYTQGDLTLCVVLQMGSPWWLLIYLLFLVIVTTRII